MECVWYMRTVELPADWTAAGRRTILNIGACDYETEVFVNGKYIDNGTCGTACRPAGSDCAKGRWHR